MKKTRKLLALVLALMMAFSCMVMPAMAHGDEDEGIMLLPAVRPCTESNCSGVVTMRTITRYMQWETTCKDCNYPHMHRVPYLVDIEYCDSCSYSAELKFYGHDFPGVCMHK
ncbi:MAG: hypothetical protein K2O45_00660 [Oscillospiraceae bacterium]|nr:hypothetical protein [Oscillospiraceae bacterium]